MNFAKGTSSRKEAPKPNLHAWKRQVIEEYANDLREIIGKLRRKPN